jgi:hypothetical protein
VTSTPPWRSIVGLATDAVVRRRLVAGPFSGLIRGHVLRRGEPAELARAIEPDEDLAEQPVVARRLASSLDRLHGNVGNRP